MILSLYFRFLLIAYWNNAIAQTQLLKCLWNLHFYSSRLLYNWTHFRRKEPMFFRERCYVFKILPNIGPFILVELKTFVWSLMNMYPKYTSIRNTKDFNDELSNSNTRKKHMLSYFVKIRGWLKFIIIKLITISKSWLNL